MFNEDMLNKLQGLKAQADESKAKLDELRIEEEAGGGLVRVTLNGNRKLLSLNINTDIKLMDNEDLEDLLTVAFSRALDKANEINEKEVMSSAQSFFPGF